jgi:hypothetical protein
MLNTVNTITLSSLLLKHNLFLLLFVGEVPLSWKRMAGLQVNFYTSMSALMFHLGGGSIFGTEYSRRGLSVKKGVSTADYSLKNCLNLTPSRMHYCVVNTCPNLI